MYLRIYYLKSTYNVNQLSDTSYACTLSDWDCTEFFKGQYLLKCTQKVYSFHQLYSATHHSYLTLSPRKIKEACHYNVQYSSSTFSLYVDALFNALFKYFFFFVCSGWYNVTLNLSHHTYSCAD